MTDTTERLEELRAAIRAERISWGELAELQGLADEIDRSDVELLEWADVPEYCPRCGIYVPCERHADPQGNPCE